MFVRHSGRVKSIDPNPSANLVSVEREVTDLHAVFILIVIKAVETSLEPFCMFARHGQ